MATVTGMTAAAMQSIRDGTITAASFDSANHLILTKHDGTQIDAGTVSAATTGQSGLVQLAQSADVDALTDTAKAVTAASMSNTITGIKNRLTSLEHTEVQIVTGFAETDSPAAWPYAISMQSNASGSGWTPNGGSGVVITYSISSDYTVQEFYAPNGVGSYPYKWIRSYSTASTGGWTPWSRALTMANLTPASFTQTTAASSYPTGESRIFYSSSNGAGWDFNGTAGEVRTYSDGTSMARQTFTSLATGSGNKPSTWVRTSDFSNGWSAWIIDAEDTGWLSAGTLASGFTQQTPVAYRRRHGFMSFHGSFTVSTSGTFTTVFTVPSQYRPSQDLIFPVSANTAIYMSGQIKSSTGEVQAYISGATTAWFSVAALHYPLG